MKYGIEIWNNDGLVSKKTAKNPDHARSVLKRELLKILTENPSFNGVGSLVCNGDIVQDFNKEEILEASV